MENVVGKVLAMALRSGEGGPMVEIEQALARENAGLEPKRQPRPKRGVTLLSAVQWEQTLRELDARLPWHARRANVLLDAGCLRELMGKTVRLGEALVEIKGETKPCAIMDQALPGLREALMADWRGGVFGRVLEGGLVRVGDEIRVVETNAAG